ncbi:hypothetical protein RKE85_001367 [Serratia marcescens]|nr:hypothetical protein [Serratia marcescens]
MVQRYNPDYVMHAARFAPFAREAEHGEFVKFFDYEVLKAERDALAVENAAQKDAITTHSQSTHFCELCGKDDPCSTDDVCYALKETPVTDAALAAIQARAKAEAFAEIIEFIDRRSGLAEMKTPWDLSSAIVAHIAELREAK